MYPRCARLFCALPRFACVPRWRASPCSRYNLVRREVDRLPLGGPRPELRNAADSRTSLSILESRFREPLIANVMGLAALQVGAASSVVVQRAGDARGCPAVESSVPWCAATAMPDWDSRRAIEKGRSPSPVTLVARSRHRGAVFNVHRPCRPRCDLQWCGRITLIGAPGGALSSANVGLDGIESSLASPLRVASARGCLSAGSAVGYARAQ